MKRFIAATFFWILSASAPALAIGPQGFAVHDSPQDVANIQFNTEDGRSLNLEDFRGKTVLINVWATWCPPCVKEMPTLDRLQAKLGSDSFEVIALSIDRAGAPAIRRFFDKTGVENLAVYVDKTMLSATALRAIGLPATILINEEGKEIGRLMGPAEWDTPEIIEFLQGMIN